MHQTATPSLVPPPPDLPTRRRAWVWPLVPVGLMAPLLLLHGTMFVLSNRDPSFAVEQDYYKKSTEWDAHLAQRRDSEALGWSTTLSVSAAATETLAEVRVHDANGDAVAGANVSVVAYHNARAALRRSFALKETAPGVYVAGFVAERAGLWQFELTAQRDADRFTKELQLDLGGAVDGRRH